ncbi:GNAT family N-acetyltransferase [Streptomyces sp. NPDC051322]|uniref:GNAT family N-acetyltransferase n=1 Tax=Streptomyces sp. NPDC051322 TaxID=3154645 RepID=UPI00344E9407
MTSLPGSLPEDLAGSGGTDVPEVHFRPFDRWQADDHREELADLYVAASPATPGEEYQRREDFLARLEADTRRPGFTMFIAETSTLVACAYGYLVDRDGSWWPELETGLPPSVEQLTAAGEVFAVAQLMVLADHRRSGIGASLRDQLLSDQEATVGVTLVEQADDDGLAVCRAWGWQDIGGTAATMDGPPLRAFMQPLERSDR